MGARNLIRQNVNKYLYVTYRINFCYEKNYCCVYTATQRHRDRAFIIYGESCGNFEGERVLPFSLVTVGVGATQRLKDKIAKDW